MTTTIELKNISKYFGSVIALKDISISVNSGEVLCLLGDNGAGKSTLIKTLAGVHQPDEGDMFLEGKNKPLEGSNTLRRLYIILLSLSLYIYTPIYDPI